MENMTLEQVQDFCEKKAAELTIQYAKENGGKNILPIIVYDEDLDEYIAGYFTTPTREQKAQALGTLNRTASTESAGLQLMRWCLLEQHSDPRLYSTKEEHDALAFAAANRIILTIKIATEVSKKK